MAVMDQQKKPKIIVVRPARASAQSTPKDITVKTKTKLGVVKSNPAKLAEFRRILQLTQPEFARLVPISVRSLASLEAGAAQTEAVSHKLIELERLASSVSEVMRQETIGTWLKTPNPAFDGLKPLEVIERGEIDPLWSMIYSLRSGVPS
jgi:DNA-binding transcriptional regulator YiaG